MIKEVFCVKISSLALRILTFRFCKVCFFYTHLNLNSILKSLFWKNNKTVQFFMTLFFYFNKQTFFTKHRQQISTFEFFIRINNNYRKIQIVFHFSEIIWMLF